MLYLNKSKSQYLQLLDMYQSLSKFYRTIWLDTYPIIETFAREEKEEESSFHPQGKKNPSFLSLCIGLVGWKIKVELPLFLPSFPFHYPLLLLTKQVSGVSRTAEEIWTLG